MTFGSETCILNNCCLETKASRSLLFTLFFGESISPTNGEEEVQIKTPVSE